MIEPGQQLTFEDLNQKEVELRILPPERLYEIADASLLRRLGRDEDSRFERKVGGIGPRELAEYFAMWANTPEGGLIIVGQEDRGDLVGLLSLSTRQINAIEDAAPTHCPDVLFHHKRVNFNQPDGSPDFVLVFLVEAHKSRAVKTTNGKYFVRVGDKKRELRNDEEVRQLKADKGEISAELEPVELGYPRDFDIDAMDEWVRMVISKGGLSPEYQSRENVLADNRLGKQEPDGFVPNVACALLFAKRPTDAIPGARIHFLRFDGTEQGSGKNWNATKDTFIEGTIPEQIERCAEVLRSQLRNFTKLGPGGKFYTDNEYPEDAWYEALVNACVHRTYSNGLRNSSIFVRMFDDRLEMESPGSLPPFVTPDNIYDMHNPRNPRLMSAMVFMGLTRMAREGTRRMRDTMKEANLPEPEFRHEQVSAALVRVTLRNSIEQRKVWVDGEVSKHLADALLNGLDEEQKRCVNWAAENSGLIGVSDAQRLTGRSWPTCKKFLDELTNRGIFTFIHSDKDRDPKARYLLIGFKNEK